jgi:glycosyltransferase involved in cell wall biosynthesis
MTFEDGHVPSSTPRLTIGLPVYNGERTLRAAMDSLLMQTFEDYELLISDNASTDGTEAICREYASRDTRVRFHRSPVNRGLAWNHNHLADLARGAYFKWASHDDVYHPELLRRCIEVLDEDNGVVLCHSLVADIDLDGKVVKEHEYLLNTAAPRPSKRFKELLLKHGGHDFYGVMRTDVVRRTPMIGSFHQYSERPKLSAMALYGRFHQVPEVLFYHREHTGSTQRTYTTPKAVAPILDPRRANRFLHPVVRLRVGYVLTFIDGIRRAPLPRDERWRCYGCLAAWLARHARQRMSARRRADSCVLNAAVKGGTAP